ncbi:glycosyltransferase family 4 protein [Bradyrhizobium sp. ARR65]|uniref:glycosyltransferase family 4 protein n=1 Tax=Bradyrhizobium sp. ARR65 TaxID=1040989 RepID=UPI00046415B1|nr:glycosyltransferase family 4 protein [Bradyrhizobium sp. ARR65]
MNRLSDLRILLTTDTIGGVWTYASGLASALASRGADVHLVTMGPPPREDQRAMISASSVHLVETSLALEWQDPEGRNVAAARRFLGGLEARLRPDMVHLNSFREAAFEWNCPAVIGAHSCVNSWAAACKDTAWLSEARWRNYAGAVAAGLHHAQAWVCPSRAYHDIVVDLYRPRSPGFVIWNGIASADAPPDRKGDFILAAGRMWDAAKNLSTLLHAGGRLNWPVLVAGPAESSQNGPSAIQLLGQVSHAELARLMRRAAIFVSPALYEPFGLSVLEAASAGCALVLSDIPTFRELWDGAAFFVDPTDATVLHRTLAELSGDAAKRTALQQAAAARSRNYSLRRMIDCYVVLYQGLLAPGPKPTLTPALEASL